MPHGSWCPLDVFISKGMGPHVTKACQATANRASLINRTFSKKIDPGKYIIIHFNGVIHI